MISIFDVRSSAFCLDARLGVGEAGITGAPPAVVNAAIDALRHLGVSHMDMPLTPERVWRAIRDAQK